MKQKFYIIIREVAGRIEVLSGPIYDDAGQDNGLEKAKSMARQYFQGASVAETVWG